MGIILGLVALVFALFVIATIWGVVDAIRQYRRELKDPEKVYRMGLESANTGRYGPAAIRFRNAARMGHAGAAYNLGILFSHGKGVRKNPVAAFSAFKYAAELGLPDGEFNVALCFAKGFGTEKDPAKAIHHFKAAIDQGYKLSPELAQEIESATAGLHPYQSQAE